MTNGFTPRDYEFLDKFIGHFEAVKVVNKTERLCRCPDPNRRHTNGDRNPSLSIGLGQNGKGPMMLVNCVSQECPKEDILKAVGLELSDLYVNKNGASGAAEGVPLPGCTLEQFAEFKNLPVEFLKSDDVALEDDEYYCRVAKKTVPAVLIRYASEGGEELENCATWRTGLHKTEPDTRVRRLSKSRGGELSLYGLHRLEEARKAGFVLVVEGESDVLTAWYHGRPAVGVPGARNWRDEWARHLDGIGHVLVCAEPDEAGEKLWRCISNCRPLVSRVQKVVLSHAL